MAYNIAPSKQDLLVSGTNIKTINSNSILGSGNLTVAGLPTSTNPTDADKVVAVDSSGVASWQYAGLGSGSFGTDNIILGRSKPTGLTGITNTIIGPSSAGNAMTTATRMVIIGAEAGKSLSTGNQSVIIGDKAALATTNSNYDVIIGERALLSSTASGGQNVIIGFYSAVSCTGTSNVCIGDQVAGSLTSASNTVSIGAGANASNSNSVCIGVGANTSSTSSVAVGPSQSSRGATTVLIGSNSSSPSGSNNIMIGTACGPSTGTGSTGADNIAIGASTMVASPGNVFSGSRNIFLGKYTGKYSSTQSDELFIDNQDRTSYALQQSGALLYGVMNATPSSQTIKFNAATTSTYGLIANEIGGDYDSRIEGDTDQNLVFVDASTDRVGIGTATPSEKLEVNGNILASEVAVANYKLSPKVHDEGTEPGNFTINWANSPVQLVELNGSTNAVVTLSNPVTGGAYALKIVQGATPGTIDFTAGSFANVKWPGGTAPTLSGTTGDIDLINLLYIGTTYYGTFALDFA